jgi:histidine phosphotransferase ChpT
MLSTTASAYTGTSPDLAPDLGALVGSRICHDLISPLGAIGNGVELIALSGMDDTPEMALIAESVENANARIRFFRVAFGAAEVEQTIGAQEVAAIVEGLGRTGRHQIDWAAGGGPRVEVKLVFLVVLCVSSAMPWGGTIHVRRTGDSWQVSGTADRLKIDQALWDALGQPGAPLAVSSAEVEFPLARATAARIGRTLSVETGGAEVAVSF